MKFSRLFIPTTKQNPNDATLPSHQYLIRGGFISQLGAGLYNYLPLGKIVLDKIRAIVKDELDKVGCQETMLNFVTPASLWRESGRFDKFGSELLRLKDRKNNDFVLSPTNEETMVDLVRNRVKSYKQLPLNLYQIHTKFRDEARPRFGLLRGREFIMKDGYSFHESTEDMQREFALMEQTYSRIIERLGLDFRVVEADSGAIGGSGSREFMVLSENGEDDIVSCANCDYGANIETAIRAKKQRFETESVEMNGGRFQTIDVKTIEELSDFFKLDAHYLVKTIAKKAIYEDREEIVLFFVRGNENLQEVKALNAVGALELVDVNEDELREAGIIAGFIGPQIEGFRTIVDCELENSEKMICGANEKDYHIVGFDFVALNVEYKDLIEVQQGDSCKNCGGQLKISKGIEVGHIFQLGTQYSKSLNANFLDQNGKSTPFVMGTYGIGISRLMAVMIEQNHDDKGMIWNPQTAPYQLDIIISNIKDKEQFEFANNIYEELKSRGKEIVLDERKERYGFKIKDFELIGFPYALIVGKNLKDGQVEIVNRKTLEKITINSDKALEEILKII